jgi:uncharacterized membrane protein YobD (UPF0266 family)
MYIYVFIAAAATLYFAIRAAWQPRLAVIMAAIVWLLYAVYEYFVASGVLCDANCNIRVDLLVIWPLVCIASLLGIYGPRQWMRIGKILAGVSLVLLVLLAAPLLYVFFLDSPVVDKAAPTPPSSSATGAN